MMNLVAILSGIVLSWFELEWLKRNVNQMLLSPGIRGAGQWGRKFLFRWSTILLVLALCIQSFRPNLFPFLVSFLISNLILRLWYGSKAYA